MAEEPQARPKLKTVAEFLAEQPFVPPGEIQHLPDEQFRFISLNNIRSYVVLGSDADYIYTRNNAQGASGMAFRPADLHEAALRETGPIRGCKPVISVGLSPSVKGLYQACRIRIREDSPSSLAITWLTFFALNAGGVVNDFEHLQGRKDLWVGLIKTGRVTGCLGPDGIETPVTTDDIQKIWSAPPNPDLSDLFLIYRPESLPESEVTP